MKQPHSTLLGLLLIGAICCVVISGAGSLSNSVYASNTTTHEIRGTVDAVSPNDSPPVIVVKGMRGPKEEVVVGAVVKPSTIILRAKKKIGLDQIRLGEKVTMKYSKGREGLTVRSIVIHSR
jgi:hypothetical protein